MSTNDVLTILQKLPPIVYVRDLTDARYINAIKRGERGFYAITVHPNRAREITPDRYNSKDVKPQHILAMEAGSIRGWEVPAADPDQYTEEEARAMLAQREAEANAMFDKYGAPKPRNGAQEEAG